MSSDVSFLFTNVPVSEESPLAGHTSSHVKNSRHFTEMMGSVHVESDEILVSSDVSFLFTNVPVSEAVFIIRKRLMEDETLGDRTYLSLERIADLLEMCLRSTYFSFGENFYEQKVQRWAPRSLLWWPTSTWSSLRSWHWRRRRPDPGCGRGMLMTLSASSERAQPRNSFTISTGSGRPSSSRWSRKKTGQSLSSSEGN